MPSPRRGIRRVVDAGMDYPGPSEIDDSSEMTGWTSNIVNYYETAGETGEYIYENYYNNFEDDSGNFPDNDGVTLSLNLSGDTLSTLGSSIINVGLKHYFHQIQAMKGWVNSGTAPMIDYDPMSNSPSSSLSAGPTPVYSQTGRYKQTTISMGHIRGIDYSVTSLSVWSTSTNNVEEYLRNTGEISIGSTA